LECGNGVFDVIGIEEKGTRWDQESFRLKTINNPRKPKHGIFFETENLTSHIFKVKEFPTWVLCSSKVKEFFLESDFSNVDFIEVGEMV
jgi:hypothetical protein